MSFFRMLCSTLAAAAVLLLLAVQQAQAQLDVTLIGGQQVQPDSSHRPSQEAHLIVTYDPLLRLEELPCVSTAIPSDKLPKARRTRGSYNPDLSQGDIDTLVKYICEDKNYADAGGVIAKTVDNPVDPEGAKRAMFALKQARRQSGCDARDTYALLEAIKSKNQGVVPFAEVFEFARKMVAAADAVGIQMCITAKHFDQSSGRTLNETYAYTTGEGRR